MCMRVAGNRYLTRQKSWAPPKAAPRANYIMLTGGVVLNGDPIACKRRSHVNLVWCTITCSDDGYGGGSSTVDR